MNIIAYDLGTGGVKASLYNEEMQTLAKSFVNYDTFYPHTNYHEQKPSDWWKGIIKSTHILLKESDVTADSIKCLSLSGHSLVAIPIDRDGNCLLDQVPIWSDTRASEETKDFFAKIDEKDWYYTTGNGFPAACYSLFKIMWLKKNRPDIFLQTKYFLGSKDYINFLLTDNCFTDPSYASGTGAYNLIEKKMQCRFLDAAGIPEEVFPKIVPSHTIIGTLTESAATALGLPKSVSVVCGGVDNACMALGAVGSEEGRAYVSLGSSSWIPVNSRKPVLDYKKKPYVFAHIQEDMFTSAFSIFSGGSSLRWVRDTFCSDWANDESSYNKITASAALSPPGSNGIIFNPSLAGGTSQDKSTNIRGAFLGLGLGHTQSDILRATLEGITLNLKISYDFMNLHASLSKELLICGGGSKSPFWLQLFADIFETTILKTNIDQDAASLGAAAIAARGIGLWENYDKISSLHKEEQKCEPEAQNSEIYQNLQKTFRYTASILADIGDYMQQA